MIRRSLAGLIFLVTLLATASPVLADGTPPESDVALVKRYAPVLYFHEREVFYPQPVEVIVRQARLRRSRRLWFDTNVLLALDPLDLLQVQSDRTHFLDIWYGYEGGSAYTDYSAHRAFYRATLSPRAGGLPITVYARVAREGMGHVTLQYWALYFYNDWFNKHEGDWEMVQVMLDDNAQPQWVVYSQHHGGTRRAWHRAPAEEGTHPAVYVAMGSHANYFAGDEVYPNSQEIGDRRLTIVDRTGTAGRAIPDVILLPEREQLVSEPENWPGAAWIHFRGRWGEMAPHGDFSGPLGPVDKGDQWENPYAWGMGQPLDTETWYSHRLRVEVSGERAGNARVQITDRNGVVLPSVEALGSLVILHADPPSEALVATIDLPPNTIADVVATWPDRNAGRVIRSRFTNVDFGETGLARLELRPADVLKLLVDCPFLEAGATSACQSSMRPGERNTVEATWDARDFVWVGGVLPAHQVGAGLLLAVLVSVVPTMLYVGALYGLDRYEKEPRLLVTAAFLWGSVPAVTIALAAEVFFRLPPNLVSSGLSGPLSAARFELAVPLLQEALKGVAVLFIARRHRREFDNVLDGIIYGAVVGFGFAMSRNLIAHVTTFAMSGFGGFGVGPIVEGLLYSLDHAAYTAAFGASLGAARLERRQWRRWLMPVAGFAVAVTAHALHNLLGWSLLGVDAVTLVTTGAGVALIGVVADWSLRRQRRILRAELREELPETLYCELVAPGGRARARWRALRARGLVGLRGMRRLQQQCAELAFKKMQRARRPDEPGLTEEIERLRREVAAQLPVTM